MKAFAKFLAVSALGAVAVHYFARHRAEAGGALATGSPEPGDRQLRDDICRKLAQRLPDGDGIEVVVNDGDVSLRGEVDADEVDALLAGVLAMPGVRHIHNRLTPRDSGLPRSTLNDVMQPGL